MTQTSNIHEKVHTVDYQPLTAEQLWTRYRKTRHFSEELSQRLKTEDYVIQSMPDVSPTKWHLSHTSWVFETFILDPANVGYQSPEPLYAYLFNSYYISAGDRFYRPERGLLSRPTVEEVYTYRSFVDRAMEKFISHLDQEGLNKWSSLIELGIHHEQQHQELILTDIKHVFSKNPLRPAYYSDDEKQTLTDQRPVLLWNDYSEGVYTIGHNDTGFAYDNESPAHRVFLESFQLASRPVTNGEFMDFMEDGGYQKAEFWLSDGWALLDKTGWNAPLYWENRDGDWWTMTLRGMRQVNMDEPVCHMSYYEADAYASWSGARLPSEEEWEVSVKDIKIMGNFVGSKHFHPTPCVEGDLSHKIYGDVWEWTKSHYSPYHGFEPAKGTIGEYNGKFMCNQFILRGGSCATSVSHIRSTYRNFFPADARWQFSGLRLAKDGKRS